MGRRETGPGRAQMHAGHAQTCPGRAQMHAGHVQTGPSRAQTHASHAQTGPKSQKTLEGHISLKTCPNWAFEVFFGIYQKCRFQETPQMPDSDKF